MKVAGLERPRDLAIDPRTLIAGWAFWVHEKTFGRVYAGDELGFGHDTLLY